MPAIHRVSSKDASAATLKRDAGRAVDASQQLAADDDSDAGAQSNPEFDPANRNEDLETFRSLLPKQHLFAEWPMPDNGPQSKHKLSYSVGDKVIVDDVTKLRWQRELPEKYPGCTASYVYVGRDYGAGTGCTWEEAQAYCARAELAAQLGPGSWRLPTKIELESLIDVSQIPAVNPLFYVFPIDRVWSSSPVPNPESLKLAWVVDYTEGTSFESARYKGGRVRCVSSASSKGGDAVDYRIDPQIVFDNTSKLAWQRYPDSATRSWKNAIEYCNSLELDGGGWRLSSLKELLTLVDPTRRLPSIYPAAFSITQNERYWTATEFRDSKDGAYQVEFVRGSSMVDGTVNDEHYMRCVRDM